MEIIRELCKRYREQITYVFFGGMTTLVDWLIYAVITGACENFNKTLANSIAWGASVVFAFFTNKFFVFRHKSNEHIMREFLTFFGARTLSGLLQIGGFALLVESFGVNDWLVKLALAVFVVIANYVLSKFLIFKK